ncbi:MarR family winged helix-turn-helix transcriptional regulator [Ilumatobacter sp.]|uniref:MarR family winged helix-turn-helix transcriptional regulator n=1 Tax=Ilumatobacter sp. TaxID=1967498 RepID=UPI003B51A45A
MPRLDNVRVGAWRDLQAVVREVERRIDDELRAHWDISIAWFDVLTTLQRLGGSARPHDLSEELRLPASSISRRLDRLEEEGWVARHRHVIPDRRAVEVELTRSGRRLWREMNTSYRRAVQDTFAARLDDDDVAALRRVISMFDDRSTPTSRGGGEATGA